MLDFLEALITGASCLMHGLLILFVPIFIIGTITAISSGMIFHPFVLGCVVLFGLVILAALRS